MTDNIIEFKKKEVDSEPESNTLVVIKIKDNGTLNVWISQAVEDVDEIDWVKEMAFNALVTLGEALEERDDRYVEHLPHCREDNRRGRQ